MESWRILAKRRGVEIDDDLLLSAVGMSDGQFLRWFFEENGIDDSIDEWLTEKRDTYFDLIEAGIRPFPGAPEMLKLLAERMPVAIATSSARRELDRCARHLGVAELLGASVAKEDVTKHKPEPEAYLLAARRLEVEPTGCVVFEDSIAGVAAAKAAGMRCAAVTNSFAAEALNEADLIVASLADTDSIMSFVAAEGQVGIDER